MKDPLPRFALRGSIMRRSLKRSLRRAPPGPGQRSQKGAQKLTPEVWLDLGLFGGLRRESVVAGLAFRADAFRLSCGLESEESDRLAFRVSAVGNQWFREGLIQRGTKGPESQSADRATQLQPQLQMVQSGLLDDRIATSARVLEACRIF